MRDEFRVGDEGVCAWVEEEAFSERSWLDEGVEYERVKIGASLMVFLITDREEEAAGVGDAMTLPLSDWSGSRCSVMAAVAIERDLYRGGVETGKTIHNASSTISRRIDECRVSVENHDAIVAGMSHPRAGCTSTLTKFPGSKASHVA